MAQLKDLIVTGDARVIGNNYNNNPKVAYGTCATAAATAAKVVTIDDPTWNLQVGDIIGIKFTNSNSASNVTFNVNGTGAIGVSYNTSRPYTGSSTQICGYANRTLFYQYDGTYWHWFHGGYDANDNTFTSAYCSTAAGTAAKAASCNGYVLLNNSYLHIIITNSNTSAGALTLNVNGKGAKPIYINGSASSSSNYTLPAGSYLIFYNGTNYYFRTDGKLTTSITGDAATVNGKTVAVNVPSDAKFTDTTYESKAAASGGTAVSLCTTGEKYTWNSKTSNTGTVTKVSTGAGLTGGDVTTTGTIKCDLKSETKSTLEATSMGSTANKQYAVGLDKNGDLSVNIPWTDNNTTYSFTGGTNKFTYTPSGGSATDVTITPSISNNITGSGTRTSGYIAKFSGQNTITNGPQLGSATTTYLRNDGTWVNPQNVYVGSSAPTATNYQVWVDTTGTVNSSALVNLVYPVGSIYITVDGTANPNTLFSGTTWTRIKDAFLLGAGDTYSSGTTGGNATHAHHEPWGFDNNGAYGWLDANNAPIYGSDIVSSVSGIHITKSSTTSTIRIAKTETISNMPPYVTVNIWKRTA